MVSPLWFSISVNRAVGVKCGLRLFQNIAVKAKNINQDFSWGILLQSYDLLLA